MSRRLRLGALLSSLFLVFSLVAVDYADARRGGSFGSRGARSFQSAPATQTSPFGAAPVQRSMTPGQSARPGATAAQTGAAASSRRGLFGGLGGGLLGGLMLGGLFGMLMGTGFGGFGGFLALLVQGLLIGLGVMLLMRLFRGRQSAHAGAGHTHSPGANRGFDPMQMRRQATESGGQTTGGSFAIPSIGARAAGAGQPSAGAAPAGASDEIGITDADLDAFEQRLHEVQAAFAREDYAALRRLTTPEVMSYLAEELSENATSGKRNEVKDVKLLQGDLAEAWREGSDEYATVAMRYSSVDLMRDRQSGELLEGDPNTPTETVEHWTFLRRPGEEWKLTAIQS